MNPIKTVENFEDDLSPFLAQYKYQPSLTAKLDELAINFTQEAVNEIVLWKVNRFVAVSESLLRDLNELKSLRPKHHRKACGVLTRLLETHGVDLPMASALLRFRNRSAFQIIDRHAYRALYGKRYSIYSSSPIQRKIETYFNYLDDLHAICERRALDFRSIDRLLYVFDKEINGAL